MKNKNIKHADIKNDNIGLDKNKNLKLIDYDGVCHRKENPKAYTPRYMN
jgi:hypothetical protein